MPIPPQALQIYKKSENEEIAGRRCYEVDKSLTLLGNLDDTSSKMSTNDIKPKIRKLALPEAKETLFILP